MKRKSIRLLGIVLATVTVSSLVAFAADNDPFIDFTAKHRGKSITSPLPICQSPSRLKPPRIMRRLFHGLRMHGR